uniref:Tetratricopeptide repeat protein n=1 Tax=Panagrolaimus sp. JU765 TaxID=591449 RepID=A0AC34R8Q1_9BILA
MQTNPDTVAHPHLNRRARPVDPSYNGVVQPTLPEFTYPNQSSFYPFAQQVQQPMNQQQQLPPTFQFYDSSADIGVGTNQHLKRRAPPVDPSCNRVVKKNFPDVGHQIQDDFNPLQNQSESYVCRVKNCRGFKTHQIRAHHEQTAHKHERKMADDENSLGEQEFQQHNYADAHKHYDAAIATFPVLPKSYINKAAVYFEEGYYKKCIEECKKAIDYDHKANYEQLAKTMDVMGDAHVKMGNLKDALHWLKQSFFQVNDPEIVKKHKQVEKDLKDAYINVEIAEEEKKKGDALFKKRNYRVAMEHYNEAIKRNPDNAVLYSNRAACYQKLMEFHKCIEDCDTALKTDPNFVEAYLRKGAALVALLEYSLAQPAYEEAFILDPNSKEAQEGLANCYRLNDEDPTKAREPAKH